MGTSFSGDASGTSAFQGKNTYNQAFEPDVSIDASGDFGVFGLSHKELLQSEWVIGVITAKFHPEIVEAQKESNALAQTLGVKCCGFCNENFFADERPKWNKEWGSIHCGNCPMGSCPNCGSNT